MKLKLVALSMSVLGLISTPVFADDSTQMQMHKHKHHKKHHHRHHEVAQQDYKAMGAMPVEAPVPVVTSSVSNVILDEMTQNTTMAKPMPEWFNRIGVSGGINFDTGKWGSRNVTNSAMASMYAGPNSTYSVGANGPKAGYTGEDTRRFGLNNAYLNVTGDVNEWTKALMVLSYTDASFYYDQAYTTSESNTTQDMGNRNQTVMLEQGVIHLGNFDCSPFFLNIGRQFQDFGRYKVHPITATMTQALTESLRTSAQLGFVTDMGINASVYTFQDGVYKYNDLNNKENTLNYGAAVGFAHPDDMLGYDVGVGYMYNMFGVNDVATVIADRQIAIVVPPGQGGGVIPAWNGYTNRVGAVSAYADVNFEAFTLGARYVTATQTFSVDDLPRATNHLSTGAKPWAAGVQLGFDFNCWTRNQNVYLGYQASHDTVYLNLPRGRYVVGYGVDVLKNTSLSAEWDHDNAWSNSQGGPGGGNSNLVSLRAAVKFG